MWKIQVFVFNSVQSFSHVRLFATSWTTARQAPRPSPTPGIYPNSCPLSWWCHPTISSSVVPFSSCPQSFPASGCLILELSKMKKKSFWSTIGWLPECRTHRYGRLTELLLVFFMSSCESGLLYCVLSFKAEGVCYFIFCLLRNVWNSPSYSSTTQVCTLLYWQYGFM